MKMMRIVAVMRVVVAKVSYRWVFISTLSSLVRCGVVVGLGWLLGIVATIFIMVRMHNLVMV